MDEVFRMIVWVAGDPQAVWRTFIMAWFIAPFVSCTMLALLVCGAVFLEDKNG